ncbi:MAG TPA: Rrf2 family transcriptional regulator [Candidatus Polarisedimenticolaceae bacterium]|nr:Rrf2 family transcriptional regulator [Candidatus Polarisedimenticolaceae bacterium]
MISQRARYAFKAVVALARAKPGVGLQIRELCEQEKLPRKFLEQILLMLKAAGYISSRRGRDGGYELLKPTDLIYIGPMLRAVDGPIAPLSCLSRTAYRRCADCKDETHCELRIAFSQAYSVYLAALENTSLAQIMRQSDAIELPLGNALLEPTTA